nr:MAG: capsid protein [Owegonang virus 26]
MPRSSKRNPARKQMKRRPRRKTVMPNEYAKIVETHEFAQLAANSAWFDYQTSLARCERATQVARSFQEYKITKVEYHFIANTDTYLPGQYGVPQLYTRIDRTGALEAYTTAAQLAQTGVKPRRLDDKNIVISFKPAALMYARDVANATNAWAKPVVSPWLSTNKNNNVPSQPWLASSIDHLGLVWFVEQVNPSGQPNLNFTVRQRIHYEFRKPMVLGTSSEVTGTQAPSINSPEATA